MYFLILKVGYESLLLSIIYLFHRIFDVIGRMLGCKEKNNQFKVIHIWHDKLETSDMDIVTQVHTINYKYWLW